MPRQSWSGFLRLSLVSCPIYLSPATTEAERIRFNMLNPKTGNRIAMQPVDSETREPIERSETVRGYEIDNGRYVTVTDEELDELKPEKSRVLSLKVFVNRDEVDALYVDNPYYVYPEKTGEEAYRVIAKALENKKRVAIGSIVLSTREHPVMLEPHEGGLLMCTLRPQEEVRSAEFDFEGPIDKEMVELAEGIIEKMRGRWNPEQFADAYQDAVRALIESKQRGMPAPKGAPPPAATNVIDLMSVLKKSLAASARPAKGEHDEVRLSTKRKMPARGEAKTRSRQKTS